MMKFEAMQFQLRGYVLLLLPSWLHKLHIHFSETKSQLWSENSSAGNNP